MYLNNVNKDCCCCLVRFRFCPHWGTQVLLLINCPRNFALDNSVENCPSSLILNGPTRSLFILRKTLKSEKTPSQTSLDCIKVLIKFCWKCLNASSQERKVDMKQFSKWTGSFLIEFLTSKSSISKTYLSLWFLLQT